MTTTEISADTSAGANRTGLYLAFLQLVFTLGWTTYVIYLPKLAAQVGIAPSAVILILMLDQAIFTVSDTAMGIAADKIASIVGRLGVFVGALTALSCTAFIALPFVAGTGPGAQIWFIVLILIWTVTSSALRAPPLILLGKHRARPAIPFLSALAMLGYGLAGAVSPYLGVVLRNEDPRLPFVISGTVLLLTTLALSKVERGLAQETPPRKRTSLTCKAVRPGADVLRWLDGHSFARLSTAFPASTARRSSCALPRPISCNGCCRYSGSASTSRCFRRASSSSTAAD